MVSDSISLQAIQKQNLTSFKVHMNSILQHQVPQRIFSLQQHAHNF
jgi:hypothetical protein